MIYREDDLIDNPQEELLLNSIPVPYETRQQSNNSIKAKTTIFNLFSLSNFGLRAPILLFFVLYALPIFDLYPTEHTSLAITITVVFMWCFDTSLNFSSYIVSYIIPIFAVWLQIGFDKEKGTRVPANELASNFTFIFMSPDILTILGSLTLIAAIDKYKINRYFFSIIANIIQPYPRIILFLFMLMNFIFGLFSPIASTTFFVSLSIPIIRLIDPSDNFSKALLLGIAWSGNCSSIFSIHSSNSLPISKFEYFIYSIGSAIILCLIECFFLMKVFKIRKRKFMFVRASRELMSTKANNTSSKTEFSENLNFIFNLNTDDNLSEENEKTQLKRREQILQKSKSSNNLKSSHSQSLYFSNSPKNDTLNFNQYLVITILSIVFLMLSNSIKFAGHEGITSLLSIVLIFGCGLLTTNEFNTLNWTTIALAGGGLALNEVMKQSGLFDLLFQRIFNKIDHLTKINHSIAPNQNGLSQSFLQRKGFIEWLTSVLYLATFSVFSSIFTDKQFMIDKITELWSGSPVIICLSLLMVNVAQVLPVSSFSNLIVSSVLNEETNEPILSGSLFAKYGIVSELIAILVFSTIGFYLAYSLDI